MSGRSNRALLATTGVAAIAGCLVTWKLYQEWKHLQKEKEKSLPELAAQIEADDLAILTRSDHNALKRSAEQVLVDRMLHENHLQHLLKKCASHDEIEMKTAITVLSILTKTNEFKPCLIRCNVFNIVVDCVNEISEGFHIRKLSEKCKKNYNIEQTLKYCIVTVCDLVTDSEDTLNAFFNDNKIFVAFLLEIISDQSYNISQDIKRFCVLILQQMMQHESMRVNLISYGMIQRVTLCFLKTVGDTWLSKNCLQILVMYINFFEDYVTEEFLQEMAQLGIVPILIGCLKFDDSDIVYWSTALIHEFLLKDLHRSIISRIPDIINTLYQILVSSESGLQRLILRIYCFLSINDNGFKTRMSNCTPLLKRLSVCLASGNHDLVYWALLLVHDLAMMGKEFSFKIMKANQDLLQSVIKLTDNTDNGLVDTKLVAETLGFLCSCEKLIKKIIAAGSIKPILKFLKADDNTDLQFWASSLLLNLSMASEEARESIIKAGGIGLLLEMAIKESEMPQITAQASKILVMLGFSSTTLDISLKSGADSSIQIDGTEHSPMKDGINVVTVSSMDLKTSRGKTFDPSSSKDIARLLDMLDDCSRHEIVMLSTQGHVNSHLKEASAIELLSRLEKLGLQVDKLKDDGAWCLLIQSDADHSFHQLAVDQDSCNVSKLISSGDQVNNYVRDDLLRPLLNVLMSIPAGSNISKVPELEILSTLARHEQHQIVMLSTTGLLDYLAELIWCFSCMDAEQQATKPLTIAHCVGAVKIAHSLSTNSESGEKLLQSFMIEAIRSFLFGNCNNFIADMKALDFDVERRFRNRSLFSPTDDVFFSGDKGDELRRISRTKSLASNFIGNAGDAPHLDEVARNVFSPGFRDSAHSVDDHIDNNRDVDKQPLTLVNEIEAVIAQVASEKAFCNDVIEHDLYVDGTQANANARHELQNEAMSQEKSTAKLSDCGTGDPDRNFHGSREGGSASQFSTAPTTIVRSDSGQSSSRKRGDSTDRNRGSRSSDRSNSPNNFHLKRVVSEIERDIEEDDYDYDDFEEEDLPHLPDNEDENNFAESQGRLFFDLPRIASAQQRQRSSSAFDPNDWPTTRTGSLSRALNEAAQRAKSPLKDIASDLEDFDEALINMTNYALMTLYFCLRKKSLVDLKDQSSDAAKLLHILWCVMLSCRPTKRIQFGMLISAIMSNLTTTITQHEQQHGDAEEPLTQREAVVLLDSKRLTSSMIISNDQLEVYNGNWTFESAYATHSICQDLMQGRDDVSGWYYEVSLLSNGIMQIGWACLDDVTVNNYEPERGLGVGDYVTSVGFDGSRCKIWNGPIGEHDTDNKYGRNWKVGDTVSCLLSFHGDVSFWLNGQDLGIAAMKLDTSKHWHPAVSLSLDQHCRTIFNTKNFMYEPPEGYYSIQDAVSKTKPFFATTTATVEEDLVSSESHLETEASRPCSKDGDSSFSSYEVIEKSADRNLSSVDHHALAPSAFRRQASMKNKRPLESNLSFSPRDLIGSTCGAGDLFEVMYYEVKLPSYCSDVDIEIGYQSTTKDNRKFVSTLRGNTIIPASSLKATSNNANDNASMMHCVEAFGCGILWPVKKLFLTTDGIGNQFLMDFQDSTTTKADSVWPENLDEIVPFFSSSGLQINFGQKPFMCQAMNSYSYRKRFCNILYDVVLKSEEAGEERLDCD
eukprot:gene8043-8906_t